MSKNPSSSPAPAAPVVETVAGGYRVRIGKQTHFVNRRRQCSCHAPNCPALAAVADYVRDSGRHTVVTTLCAPRTFACPICGAEASGSLEKRRWSCRADSTHFYAWWAAQLQAKQAAFKQKWSPYTCEVMQAFASNQSRAAFLEQHRLTYPAQA
jgi:hypothetical protein